MRPSHGVLSIKSKLSSEEASATGVLSVYSQQPPQQASSALASRFQGPHQRSVPSLYRQMYTRYLKVVASSLIPKSVVLRLVLFRCPHPDTESIRMITEATRESIRTPTSKPYTVGGRSTICEAQRIAQPLTCPGGFGPFGSQNTGKPADRDTNPTRRILVLSTSHATTELLSPFCESQTNLY